jgi:hypothetical protein
MQQDQDVAFDGHHYLPWSLRTTPRDPIPDKSQLAADWVLHCQDQKEPLWSLKTPSGLPYGLVSSCMQGSLRQSKILESIQWRTTPGSLYYRYNCVIIAVIFSLIY